MPKIMPATAVQHSTSIAVFGKNIATIVMSPPARGGERPHNCDHRNAHRTPGSDIANNLTDCRTAAHCAVNPVAQIIRAPMLLLLL